MDKHLSVAAIEYGTVIDHLPAGQGTRIVRLLKLADHKKKVTLGLNLPSQCLGYKDLIKVEGFEVSEEESKQIALFAPHATVNIIFNFQIEKKFSVTLPDQISKILVCPNPQCICNHEHVITQFYVKRASQKVMLECLYCEKGFSHDCY